MKVLMQNILMRGVVMKKGIQTTTIK